MASKYLGTIGKWDFYMATIDGKYADKAAIMDIQHERYKLIMLGRVNKKTNKRQIVNIFCTAIRLDHKNEKEVNLFDRLKTTYHIYALGNDRAGRHQGKIGCALSCALESRETINGHAIGLPLENKYYGNYPPGFNLDRFRNNYKYKGKISLPDERVELFRHFKVDGVSGDKAASLGVYKGCFKEFIIDRIKNDKTPVTTWLFCSKPGYYQYIYRPFGAMLIPLLLKNYPHDQASPPLSDTTAASDDNTYGSGDIYYKKTKLSYRHPIILTRDANKAADIKWYDYLPLVVDFSRARDIVKTNPYFRKYPQLSQIAWRIIVHDYYLKYHNNSLNRSINFLARVLTHSYPYEGWE